MPAPFPAFTIYLARKPWERDWFPYSPVHHYIRKVQLYKLEIHHHKGKASPFRQTSRFYKDLLALGLLFLIAATTGHELKEGRELSEKKEILMVLQEIHFCPLSTWNTKFYLFNDNPKSLETKRGS